MPLYEYEPIDESCSYCREHFELIQALGEAPLTVCPECHHPCRRVLTAASFNKRPGNILSEKNLAAKGFTQYRKDKDGLYKKTAGRGPDYIKKGK